MLCRFLFLCLYWWNVLPGDPNSTGTMVSSKAKPPVKRETTYTGFLPTRFKRGMHKRKPTISEILVRKKLRKTSPARLLTFQDSPRNTKATTNLWRGYFFNICYIYLSITLHKNWQHVPWKTIRFLAYDFYIFFIKEIKKVLAMAYFELLSHQLKRTTTVLHKSRG